MTDYVTDDERSEMIALFGNITSAAIAYVAIRDRTGTNSAEDLKTLREWARLHNRVCELTERPLPKCSWTELWGLDQAES